MPQAIDNSVTESGAERRSTPRYNARLGAIVEFNGIQHDCQVLDFCLGGMFLSFPNLSGSDTASLLAPGTIIKIKVQVQSGADEACVSFAARVVRNKRGGVGVAFLDPDPVALRTVEQLVARQANATECTARNLVNEEARFTLLTHCKSVIAEQLAYMMQSFITSSTSRLESFLRKSRSNDETNTGQQAIHALHEKAYDIEYRFSNTVLDCIDNPGKVEELIAKRRDTDKSPGRLSLVEDDEFEDWLAIAETIYKLETRYQIELFELSSRLACLLNIPLDRENNPVGPTILCHAFGEAVQPLQVDHNSKQLIFKSFQHVVTECLPEFYGVLNGDLVEGHVLPDIESTLPTVLRRSNSGRNEIVDEVPRPSLQMESVARTSASDLLDANTLVQAAVNDLNGIVPAPQTSRGTATIGHETGRDALNTALELLSLLGHSNGGGQLSAIGSGVAHDRHVPDSLHPATYQLDDIVRALAQASPNQFNEAPPGQLVDWLDRSLATTAGNTNKRIGAKERGLIEIVDGMVSALLDDSLISKNARNWFRLLQVPILKVALTDSTFLHDKLHPARVLINKLAELARDDDDSEDAVGHGIHGMLSNLFAKLASADGSTVPDLKDVVREVDVISSVHKQTFESNLNEVIRHCEEEQSLLPEKTQDVVHAVTRGGKGWMRWIDRALDLQAGDVLQFADVGRGMQKTDKQLQLAWIAKSKNKFVFVDHKGMKALSLSLNELAMFLRKGLALVIQDGSRSAVDRAEFSMLQKLNEKLIYQATHDQLTGLRNRRELERMLKKAIADAQLDGGPAALCMLELAKLRSINTECGYRAGDVVLKKVAKLLDSCDPQAQVFRTGSSEFMLLTSGRTVEDAVVTANQLIKKISAMKFSSKGKEFRLEAYAGVVALDSGTATAGRAMQRVESICNYAKDKTASTAIFDQENGSESSPSSPMFERASVIDEMIEHDRLVLRCQLISPIEEDSGLESHYEVLLSVLDEQGNRLAPAEFIEAAEKHNRMPMVDRWVIKNIFQWLDSHRDQLNGFGGFAINLSGQSVNDEGFIDFIHEQIEYSNAPMDKVCFEITETVGVQSITAAVDFIMDLKKTGCQFSLDDFGTGMSSYAYLKNMPVDFLKIDGVFIKELDRNVEDYAVVKSVSEIGHFMNKRIIAEYVENQDIVGKLREIGVDFAQGYVLGMPVWLEDLDISH